MEPVQRVYLVGCYQLSMMLPWYKKLLEEFEHFGVEVHWLEMPNPKAPKLDEWVAAIRARIHGPWGEVGIIGHSLGGAASLHFIKRCVRGEELGGLALICSANKFLVPGHEQHLEAFGYDAHIRSAWCKNTVMLNGEHDPYVANEHALRVAAWLNTEITWMPVGGHFGIHSPKEYRNDLPMQAKKIILNAFGYFPTGEEWNFV